MQSIFHAQLKGQPKPLIKSQLKTNVYLFFFYILSVSATASLLQSLVFSGPSFIYSVKAHGVVHLAPGWEENLSCQNAPLRESTRDV